jgi:hypothetical protein
MIPLITELSEMTAVCFEGYSPDSETKAFDKMKQWLKIEKPNKDYRVFGHNIDAHGNLSFDPQNVGYKVYLVIDNFDPTDIKTEIIQPGKFLVTRTEGEIKNAGQWLMEGWGKVNKTVQDGNIKVKSSPRWFEEHIKTSNPDYMIVDLFLELE